ncbi:MAG: hypothetical protein ACXADH_13270 [Candidatus Kariarchaeaceae archaeon]|jgi:hypothetical protein
MNSFQDSITKIIVDVDFSKKLSKRFVEDETLNDLNLKDVKEIMKKPQINGEYTLVDF